jgi:hypothetical protein
MLDGMAVPDRPLTKSKFLRGHQCARSLYYAVFEGERLAAPSAEAQARMAAGLDVGRLARGLFPGGVWAGADEAADPVELLAGTAPAVFEATLADDAGLSARIDVLARGRRGWRLIEVKSSTSVKPEHLPDVAFQLQLARSCGLEVESVEVLHLNKDYVRRGEVDLDSLFIACDVTAQAEALLPGIVGLGAELRQMLGRARLPAVPIGPHCLDPRPCDCMDLCWAGIPEGSVFDIAQLTWKKKFALYQQGLVRITDIPADLDLSPRARLHVTAHQGGRPIVDRLGLRRFLESLTYPVFLLDFETVGPVVPRWDGTRPYGRIPFQYSLHVLRQPGAVPQHSEFLAEPGPDPRPALLTALLPATESEGTILAYYMPFELGVMKELAADFPDHRPEIERRLPRMDDLIAPFRAWQYWLPEMKGSFSIKSVAPALAPDLTYEGLEVHDGLAASLAYERLLGGIDPAESAPLQRALLDYCERDTLAMVRVLESIRRVVEEA